MHAKLHQSVAAGDMDAVEALLAKGVDVNAHGRLGKTPLITAIESQQLACFELLLANAADPELTDDFNQTALQNAVTYDWLPAVEILLARDCNMGRNPTYPLKPVTYPEFSLPDDFDLPPEVKEVYGTDDLQEIQAQMLATMNESGQSPEPTPVVSLAGSLPVLRLLVARGEPLSEADAELRREFIGLPGSAPIDAAATDFRRSRHPAFGRANPERFDDPFCLAMIRSGQNAYAARQKFNFDDLSKPVWCYDRFGHSLTGLPDGRFIGIAGEHEDYYDPDFHVYNDVVIHDGQGGIALYRYPREVFPPTDFHSATLVDDAIIIIGNVGYPDDRRPNETPVFRLDLKTFAIARVTPAGKAPGWLSRHQAVYDPATATIRLSGGQLWTGDDFVPFTTAILSLRDNRWQ